MGQHLSLFESIGSKNEQNHQICAWRYPQLRKKSQGNWTHEATSSFLMCTINSLSNSRAIYALIKSVLFHNYGQYYGHSYGFNNSKLGYEYQNCIW